MGGLVLFSATMATGCTDTDEAGSVPMTSRTAPTSTTGTARSTTTAATTSTKATTSSTPVPSLDPLNPVSEEFLAIPIGSGPTDWGCGQLTLADVAWGDVVFDGHVIDVGEQGEFFDGWWTIVGRMVTFAVDSDVVGASDDDRLELFWPEQYSRDGYRWLASGPDLDAVSELDSSLVFTARVGEDDEMVLQVAGVASDTASGVSFNGECSNLEPIADDVAPRLGYTDAMDMLRQTAMSHARGGDDLSVLDAETFAYWDREDAD